MKIYNNIHLLSLINHLVMMNLMMVIKLKIRLKNLIVNNYFNICHIKKEISVFYLKRLKKKLVYDYF